MEDKIKGELWYTKKLLDICKEHNVELKELVQYSVYNLVFELEYGTMAHTKEEIKEMLIKFMTED